MSILGDQLSKNSVVQSKDVVKCVMKTLATLNADSEGAQRANHPKYKGLGCDVAFDM